MMGMIWNDGVVVGGGTSAMAGCACPCATPLYLPFERGGLRGRPFPRALTLALSPLDSRPRIGVRGRPRGNDGAARISTLARAPFALRKGRASLAVELLEFF